MDTIDSKGIALFTIPENPQPSERFRKRFNDVAKELKVPLEWIEDKNNPLAVDASELKVAADSLAKYDLKTERPSLFNDALVADVKKVLAEAEKQRLVAVKKSFAAHERVSYRAPLENLNKAEQEAVRLFATEVRPALNRIAARQLEPGVEKLAAWMVYHGDYYSKILFSRFQYDVCPGPFVNDPICSLAPFYPNHPAINGMIAPEITFDEVNQLAKNLNPDAEELRPTTFLKRKNGKIVAIPLPLEPGFRRDHLEMAAALEKIARLKVDGDTLDPQVQDQLKKWAKFFRTGAAKDEAAAAQATIDAGESKGNLRFNIGPSESYWPDNMKFPYLLQVGIRDPKISARLAATGKRFQELEASLTDIPHYTPRSLSTRGGFADPIYQAVTGGFIEMFPYGEPAGNNFPNYAGYHAKGSNRFILLEVVAAWVAGVKVPLSRLVDEDVSKVDVEQDLIEDTVNHESGHLLGPPRGHVTPSGERMATVFGKHWGSADEPKADLTADVAIRMALAKGEITEEEAKERIFTRIGFHVGVRYRGKAAFPKLSDHDFGHMIQVGAAFKSGALSLVAGKIHVDVPKYLETSYALWKEIMRYQAAGDLKGYLEFGRELVSHIPDEADKMILDANKDIQKSFVERHL